jgi:hypothetical protein
MLDRLDDSLILVEQLAFERGVVVATFRAFVVTETVPDIRPFAVLLAFVMVDVLGSGF